METAKRVGLPIPSSKFGLIGRIREPCPIPPNNWEPGKKKPQEWNNSIRNLVAEKN